MRLSPSRLFALAPGLVLAVGLNGAVAQPAPQAAVKPPAKPPAKAAPASPQRVQVRSAAELCAQMVRRLPNVSRPLCERAELQAGPGASVRGTPIFQRDVVSPQARLKVLVVGGIHGDEPSSSSLVT